jgi:hypothetical protein
MQKKEFQKGGCEYVTTAISEAVNNLTRTAVISGYWEIDREIRLPSDFTLILKDCHLRLADGVYSNIFVNESHGTERGRTVAGTDRNISIIGSGEAILDGGKYNGLSEKNYGRDGLPPIWKNNLLLFTNVDGFRISGIHCRNQRWWTLNFVYCSNGYLGNIDFCANDIGIDENGNEYHGLRRDLIPGVDGNGTTDYHGMWREKYDQILVKNSDGIDLRQGCHHIVIENITGFCEDDSIALTALNGMLERTFSVEGLPSDLCYVTIRNIRTASFFANVRLLNQGDLALHHIDIDGVYDMGRQSPHMDRGFCAVRVGDTHFYGARHATANETHHISIKNVRGGGLSVISLAGEIGDLVMYGIESFDGARLICDERQ